MASTQDKYLKTMGFLVQIGSGSGKGEAENWLSASGGGQQIEVSESTTGNEQFKLFVPGLMTVAPITLEGFLNPDRKNMVTWINDTAAGKSPRNNVTIQPRKADGSVASSHVYGNCLIAEYTYPSLHSHTHDPLKEKVTIHAETLSIQ